MIVHEDPDSKSKACYAYGLGPKTKNRQGSGAGDATIIGALARKFYGEQSELEDCGPERSERVSVAKESRKFRLFSAPMIRPLSPVDSSFLAASRTLDTLFDFESGSSWTIYRRARGHPHKREGERYKKNQTYAYRELAVALRAGCRRISQHRLPCACSPGRKVEPCRKWHLAGLGSLGGVAQDGERFVGGRGERSRVKRGCCGG